jgi:hypothetical protein
MRRLAALPILAVLAAPALLAPGRAGAQPAQAPAMFETLLAERAIIAVVDAIDREVDAKDWAALASRFAPTLRVDFSSLTGQPPATIPAAALLGAWQANLTAAKTSLHLRTNHQVTLAGDRASVVSHGYAWNRMEGNGDPLWEVWGVYQHTLLRDGATWRVDGFTFRMTAQRGNAWVRDTPGR